MPVHGDLHVSGGVVSIEIDQPTSATGVVVKLFELDENLAEAEETEDDLLVTFTVDVARGRVTVNQVQDGPATGKTKRGSLQVSFANPSRGASGDPQFVQVLHDPKGEQDALQLELGLVIEAGGETYDSRAAKVGGHVAHVDATANGPVMALLVGATSDTFFGAAEAYWEHHADQVVGGPRALSQLLAQLSRLGRAPFDRPCHEVNVVAHGSVGTFKIAINAGQGVDDHNAIALRRVGAPASLARVDPATTRVVIRGCLLGNDDCLLNALSRLFGGATVFAPKHLQVYHGPSAATVREYMIENFSVDVPEELTEVQMRGRAAELGERLRKKYVDGEGRTIDWPPESGKHPFQVMLETTQASWGTNLPLWFGHVKVDRGPEAKILVQADPPLGQPLSRLTGSARAQAETQLEQQALDTIESVWPELRGIPEDASDELATRIQNENAYKAGFEREFDGWKFIRSRIEPFRRGGKIVAEAYRVVFSRRVRTRVDARRILTTASSAAEAPTAAEPLKNVARPELSNSDQFGQSGGSCVLD